MGYDSAFFSPCWATGEPRVAPTGPLWGSSYTFGRSSEIFQTMSGTHPAPTLAPHEHNSALKEPLMNHALSNATPGDEQMPAPTHESEVAPGDSTLRQAGPGYGQSFMLPATMQLFIKGMDLRPLVRTRNLSRHWLEFVSPDSRTKTTGEELKGHLDAPMRTLPDCFMEVIREHYRNVIVERIGGKPLEEILRKKLGALGTSLSSRNLYSAKYMILDKRELETLLKSHFDRAGTFSVKISKEKVWEHGQWSWTMRSTTVD